ncbi:MAG: cytochrome c-type biogenesis protein CcmH [Thermodesulfobacteriota bacterium]
MLKKIVMILVLSFGFYTVAGVDNLVTAQSKNTEVRLSAIEEISDAIMSPGCDYKYTLSNCPSVQALELKELIEGKLLAGETKKEILDYLVGLYGVKVLAAPEKRGFYLLAWWVPYFVIADGALIVAIIMIYWKKRSKQMAASVLTDEDSKTLHAYEDKVEDELNKMDF